MLCATKSHKLSTSQWLEMIIWLEKHHKQQNVGSSQLPWQLSWPTLIQSLEKLCLTSQRTPCVSTTSLSFLYMSTEFVSGVRDNETNSYIQYRLICPSFSTVINSFLVHNMSQRGEILLFFNSHGVGFILISISRTGSEGELFQCYYTKTTWRSQTVLHPDRLVFTHSTMKTHPLKISCSVRA